MNQKKNYTIYGYDDMDGGIAAAICLRHLRQKYLQLNDRHSASKKTSIEHFEVEPVVRPLNNTLCLAGYLRTHHKDFGIPESLIEEYDDFIDFAEIVHRQGNINSKFPSDSYSQANKIKKLFHTTHPLFNKKAIYKELVFQISKNSSVEDFFDSNLLFANIIEYEIILIDNRIKK